MNRHRTSMARPVLPALYASESPAVDMNRHFKPAEPHSPHLLVCWFLLGRVLVILGNLRLLLKML